MGTAEGGRGTARPPRGMPRLHSHRTLGRMSKSAAGEPAGRPVQRSKLPAQPSKLLRQVSKLLQVSELRRLFTTFGYLVAKLGTTAVLGLGYWVLATRLFSAEDVGLASAASSAAFFLGAVGSLGIPLLLLAELGSVPAAIRRVTLSTGMYISCLAVLILSLITLVLSPFLGDSLRIIGAHSTTAALLVIGSVATMGALTFDNAAAIGLHRGSGAADARHPELRAEAGSRGGPGPHRYLDSPRIAVCLGSGTDCLARDLFPHAPARTDPGRRRKTQPSGGTHPPLRRALSQAPRAQPVDQFHLLHHCADCSSPGLPTGTRLLLDRAGGVVHRNDHPIPAWRCPCSPRYQETRALLHRHVRRTLPLGLALSGGVLVVVEVAAPLVMRIFGPAYAMNGTTALRLLLLVGPAYVIKDHYVAIRRAQGRLGHAAKTMAAGTSAEAAGAVLGGIYWGMTGLCIGWIIGAACEAAFLLPAVLRVFRGDPPVEPDPVGSSG